MIAVVGLTTSHQPWGDALPRTELNLGFSDPRKCSPLTSGLWVFIWSRAGYYFPCSAIKYGAEQQRSQSHFTVLSPTSHNKPHHASGSFYLLQEITQPWGRGVMPREVRTMTIFQSSPHRDFPNLCSFCTRFAQKANEMPWRQFVWHRSPRAGSAQAELAAAARRRVPHFV